jgi:hypothetical protein
MSNPASMFGEVFTVTVCDAVFVQPAADVPVTVYVVVIAGDGETDALVPNPLSQEYDAAPVAVSEIAFPSQTVFAPLIAIVGDALTETITLSALEQPFASVPVTVYDVELVGETVTNAPVPAPLSHVYDVAPEAVKSVEIPPQIATSPLAVTVGKALMLTTT